MNTTFCLSCQLDYLHNLFTLSLTSADNVDQVLRHVRGEEVRPSGSRDRLVGEVGHLNNTRGGVERYRGERTQQKQTFRLTDICFEHGIQNYCQ